MKLEPKVQNPFDEGLVVYLMDGYPIRNITVTAAQLLDLRALAIHQHTLGKTEQEIANVLNVVYALM